MSQKHLLTVLLSLMAVGLSGGAVLFTHAYLVCAENNGGRTCEAIADKAAERWTQLGVNTLALITNILRKPDGESSSDNT
jgi:hypothetical protein